MFRHLQDLRLAGWPLIPAAVFLLNGCATPSLDLQEPTTRQYTVAQNVLNYSPIDPSRNVPRTRMLSTVNRVLPRVRTSAFRVCQRLYPQEERCNLMHTADVTVNLESEDINAYADQNNDIGIHGGLVTNMGTDDEIAAVLAHEYAHVMHGHVGKRTANTAIGMIIGATLGMAIESRTDSSNPGQTIADLTTFGGAIGSAAYSPEMEIEADRTAIYVLKDAGFDISGMKNAIIRLSRLRAKQWSGVFSGKVGFLETHPSDNRRVAHIISATEDVDSGVPLASLKRK